MRSGNLAGDRLRIHVEVADGGEDETWLHGGLAPLEGDGIRGEDLRRWEQQLRESRNGGRKG